MRTALLVWATLLSMLQVSEAQVSGFANSLESSQIIKAGKARCLKGKGSYQAVQFDRTTNQYVPTTSLMASLRQELNDLKRERGYSQTIYDRKKVRRIKKKIQKVSSLISACNSLSAPQAGDLSITLNVGESVQLPLSVQSDFPGKYSVLPAELPVNSQLSGTYPDFILVAGNTTGTETFRIQLKRKKYTNFITVRVTIVDDSASVESVESPIPTDSDPEIEEEVPSEAEPTTAPTPEVDTTTPPVSPTPPAGPTPTNPETPAPTPTFTPAPRPIVAIPQTLEILENSTTTVVLQGTGDNLVFELLTQPSIGELTGSAPRLEYKVRHLLGTTSFQFVVKSGDRVSAPATVTLKVKPRTAEFAGVVDSTESYRENITMREAAHLCRKVAFGCNIEQLQYGAQVGLTRFVDYLLSHEPEDIEEVNALADSLSVTADNFWNTQTAQRYWMAHLVGDNPVQARMSLFWHDHFAVDLHVVTGSNAARSAWHPAYIELIRGEALGSFAYLFEGMHSDPAMQIWLDNQTNAYVNGRHLRNENYAREVLELFSMGVADFFTGEPNYTEDDMRELSKALSGMRFNRTTVEGQTIDTVEFQQSRLVPGEKVLFFGRPWESIGDYNFQTVNDPILNNHPGTARNIAGKLVRVFSNPNPSERVVVALAEQLKSSNYNIKETMRKLMMSSQMFATEAQDSCIIAPIEQAIGLVRSLKIPVKEEGMINALFLFARESGQEMLRPPSVFGWKGCGVGGRSQDVAIGDNLAGTGPLLARKRQLVTLLAQAEIRNTASFFDSLLPNGNPSETEVIDHLSLLLGVDLADEERQLLVRFLNTEYAQLTNETKDSPWNPLQVTETRKKLAGLLLILSFHPTGLTQ